MNQQIERQNRSCFFSHWNEYRWVESLPFFAEFIVVYWKHLTCGCEKRNKWNQIIKKWRRGSKKMYRHIGAHHKKCVVIHGMIWIFWKGKYETISITSHSNSRAFRCQFFFVEMAWLRFDLSTKLNFDSCFLASSFMARFSEMEETNLHATTNWGWC